MTAKPVSPWRTWARPLAVAAVSLASFAAYAQRGYLDQKDVPGDFDYYVLAMSWSPTHCATANHKPGDTQCNPRSGRRYGFILHGLWPQYDRSYPENCRLPQRPWVPNSVIDDMRDIMPSRGLVIYQYKKHGTCSGLAPTPYFRLARKSFDSIKIPPRYRNPDRPQYVSQRELKDDFLRANPALKPDMIVISCGRGNRLREVRICMTKEGRPRSCGRNQNQNRLCRATRLYVPPVRSGPAVTSGSKPKPKPAKPSQPLPLPRIIDDPNWP